MAHPKAYDPQQGQVFQIFCRNTQYANEYEHCDYATNYKQRDYLIGEYALAYGAGWQFKYVVLPKKFWPELPVVHARQTRETIIKISKALYEDGGVAAVIAHANKLNRPFAPCIPCNAEMPVVFEYKENGDMIRTCLCCGTVHDHPIKE